MATAPPVVPQPPSQPAPAAAVVMARDLSKRFGATQALTAVGVEIQAGEVRALVGRNGAGKSTLVSLLTGLVAPDTGEIVFSGEPAPRLSERELWQARVACVYQHPMTIASLSCAENLFLSDNMRRKRLVSWSRMRREARAVFEEWALDMDVDAPASALGVGQRQLLEIARAVMQGSRLVILDEPTSKLDGREVDRLFEHIGALRAREVGVLFISHHLDEIFEVCQTVTVLRDGRRTLDCAIDRLARSQLIEAMVGADSDTLASIKRSSAAIAEGPALLRVQGLTCTGCFQDISFELRAGERVGLAGLAGSGKEAIGEALAGLERVDHGSMCLEGGVLPGGDVTKHSHAGIGFVPQDRHSQGLVLGMSVAENATMAVMDQLGPLGFIRPATLDQRSSDMIRQLDIKTAGPAQPVAALSGGNQQKVVLARAIARRPSVLVLINPTCGVDIASKAALFESIVEVSKRGAAVLVISDELEELDICDRVLVIRSGRITCELTAPWRGCDIVAGMEGLCP